MDKEVKEVETVADEYITQQFFAPETDGKFATEDFTFRLVTGKSGRGWLVPDPEYRGMGGNLYCTDSEDWDKRGQGFGGSTLTFKLREGGTFDLKGGWHSNASGLFDETGVDLRQRHVTFVVLSKGADYMQPRTINGHMIFANIMTGIVHQDPPEGVEGYFMRGRMLAVKYVQEHDGEAVFEYSASDGGSSFGRVGPEVVLRDPEDMW